jgi:hypothetical protein
VAAAWLVLAALPSAAIAQVSSDSTGTATRDGSGAEAGAGRAGCLHGARPPACSSIWIVELQASTPLVRPSYEVGDGPVRFAIQAAENQYEWNVGHLVSAGSDWALGGTVTLGTGANDVFTGLRARARRWVGDAMSVEVEAGLARSNGNHAWLEDQTGWSTGVRFNIHDYGAAFVRYDGYRAPDGPGRAGSVYPPIRGTQHIVRGGVGLGGGVALAGTGAALVAYAVLLGLFIAGGGAS